MTRPAALLRIRRLPVTGEAYTVVALTKTFLQEQRWRNDGVELKDSVPEYNPATVTWRILCKAAQDLHPVALESELTELQHGEP